MGFSPYVLALAEWSPGLTSVFCYECRSFTLCADDSASKTFRCGRIDCNADLLKQPVHLRSFQSNEENDADST